MATRDASADSYVTDGESATSETVEKLRQAIVRGEFSPNERLVEAELATRFGFSRGAVRSALTELVHEGLVERERNRGARVRAVSFDEAIELTEVRVVLEGLCAAKAAERATDVDVEALWATLEAMEAAAERNDLVEYSELNLRLHERVRSMSGHQIAGSMLERLRNQSVRHQFLISLVPGRTSVSLPEHRAIVAAIAARDAESARRTMEEHLESVIGALTQIRAMNLPNV